MERHDSTRRIVDWRDFDDEKCVMEPPNTNKYKRTRACLLFLSIAFGSVQLACGIVLGTVEAVLSFIPKSVSHHLQTPLPVYVCAVMTSLSGLSCIVGGKTENSYLLFGGIFMSMSTFIVSLANLLSVAITTMPLFASFRRYQYLPDDNTCAVCTELDVGVDDKCHGYTFNDVSNCATIEFTMPSMTFLLLIVYGASCITAFLSSVHHSVTLCFNEKHGPKKLTSNSEVEVPTRERSNHSSNVSPIMHDANLQSDPHHSHRMNAGPDVFWTHLPSHRPISCEFEGQNSRHPNHDIRKLSQASRPMYDVNHALHSHGSRVMCDNGQSLTSTLRQHIAGRNGRPTRRKEDGNECCEGGSDWANLCELPVACSAQLNGERVGKSKPLPPPYSIVSYADTRAVESNSDEEETCF